MKYLLALLLLITPAFVVADAFVDDTETYFIEEGFVRHNTMWWLDSGDHPQVVTFFVEVPAPNPSKELLKITLGIIEMVRYHFSVINLTSISGTVSTDQVKDYLTIGIRGVESRRLLYDELNLLHQYVDLAPQEYGESLENFTVRLASGSITDDDTLDNIENFNRDSITLVIRFDSRYNVIWKPHNLWFLHKLMIFSGFYGKITYVYKS